MTAYRAKAWDGTQWVDLANTFADPTGYIVANPSIDQVITSQTATTTPLTIKGASGQTDKLFEAQNNAGSVVASIDNAGNIVANSFSTANVSATEFSYLDGVTSAIQTQLNGKQSSITGGATTITSSNLTSGRTLISDGSGKVAVSNVDSTTLGYLDATSSVQTQLNSKFSASKIKGYWSQVSTNGSGYYTQAHYLGTTPTSVVVCNGGSPVIPERLTFDVISTDATNFTVRVYRQDTGGAFAANPVHFYWIAIAV